MSVRGGRGPREPMAVPVSSSERRKNGYQRTGRYGRGPATSAVSRATATKVAALGGLLRFIIFLAVLAVLVLVVMATVARPLVRMVVVPLAEGTRAPCASGSWRTSCGRTWAPS